jgi:chromosomal replication initiation ATPase DnaA
MTRISNAKSFWADVLKAVRAGDVNGQSFQTWLGPTRLRGMSAGCLVVEVPTEEFADVIRERFKPQILQAVRLCGEEFSDINFVVRTHSEVNQ